MLLAAAVEHYNSFHITVEVQYNKPLYKEHPCITNHILQPSNSNMYGKEPDMTNPVIPNTFSQSLALHDIRFPLYLIHFPLLRHFHLIKLSVKTNLLKLI